MQFIFWTIGKTNSAEFAKWENDFTKRIKSFTPFDSDVLDAGRGLKNPDQIRAEEGKKVLSRLKTEDYLILLDEKGKTFTSREFANYLEKKMSTSSGKRIVFLVGGAYGFHESIYSRANDKISLSSMTFSHQLIRQIFLEQLYRAFTIINNHPYHNE